MELKKQGEFGRKIFLKLTKTFPALREGTSTPVREGPKGYGNNSTPNSSNSGMGKGFKGGKGKKKGKGQAAQVVEGGYGMAMMMPQPMMMPQYMGRGGYYPQGRGGKYQKVESYPPPQQQTEQSSNQYSYY